VTKISSEEFISYLASNGYRIVPIPPRRGESMPKTIEHYQANAIRDQELILEQKDEISKLKVKVNQLRQVNGQYGEFT